MEAQMRKTLLPVLAIAVACSDGNPVQPDARPSLASTGVAARAGRGEFSLTVVDYPSSAYTHLYGINNKGDVVGQYLDEENEYRAFLRTRDGAFVDIDVPGAFAATGISPQGSIIGLADGASYLLRGGRFTVLSFEESSGRTFAQKINARGAIVGSYSGRDGRGHGFLLRNGTYITVDVPAEWGAVNCGLFGINARGDIVGVYDRFYDGRYHYHGFILRDGVFTAIDYPGATDTEPLGTNAAGDIVGDFSLDHFGTSHAFVLRNGTFTSLEQLLPGRSMARDIDDAGVIVGAYDYDVSPAHGFLIR
jgi:probable HAF family extracellular repeat protein